MIGPLLSQRSRHFYCFEMAFKRRADYAELMSLLAHLNKKPPEASEVSF